MLEKEQQKRLQKIEDDAFAQLIKQKVQDGEALDQRKKMEL